MCLCKASICCSNQQTTTNYSQSNYLLTCNTWYGEKCAQTLKNKAVIKTSSRCWLCAWACVSVCLLTCRLFPGWLVVMSDWPPAGFITLHQRQKQTSVASHPWVSILLFLSLSPSFSYCLSRCPIEPGFEPSVGWRWFCLADWAVGNHFDLSERQSSRCHLWSSFPAEESLMVDTHKVHKYMKITDSLSLSHTHAYTHKSL